MKADENVAKIHGAHLLRKSFASKVICFESQVIYCCFGIHEPTFARQRLTLAKLTGSHRIDW